MSVKKAVLFDLDGTLIDTAPDFIRIIRTLSEKHGRAMPSEQAIREQVSAGARAMVRLMFGMTAVADDDPVLLAYRQEFLDAYEADICVDSRVFLGLDTLLEALESAGVPWGIVTNKPRYLAVLLLEKLALTDRCAVLVCPDDVTVTKPDPEGLFLAARQLGVAEKHCLYVGDHPRDIEAGRRAGMTTVVAGFGYVPPDDKDVASWGADVVVDSPLVLAAYCEDWLKTA